MKTEAIKKMKPTNLKYQINKNFYPVYVKKGARRDNYYIWFNKSGWYRISKKDCIKN